MPESHTAITNAVLLTLLPKLQRLGQFLDTKLNGQLTVVCSDDPDEYKSLLHDTLIAPTPAVALKVAGIHAKPFPIENTPCSDVSQDTVVNMAIEQTCAPTREWFNGKYNILTAGYRNSRRSSGQRAQNYHENTLETFVRSVHWDTLLRRIGQPAMLYLLTQTSIFAALPNNCYCQITGPSISEQAVSKTPIQRHVLQCLSSKKRPADHIAYSTTSATCSLKDVSSPVTKRRALSKEKRKSEGSGSEATPTETKRRKKDNFDRDRDRDRDKNANSMAAISPSAISFKRSKIFYARRYQIESVMLRHFLLADYDILNMGDPLPDQKSIVGTQMKRMFPRQYGLENVFLPTQPSSGSVSYANLTSGAFRPDATKAKKKATGHWRLRSMKALVEEMLVSNQKCRFKALLQHYCPVVAIDKESNIAQTNIASLLQNCSTFDQVTSFVHAIVKKVIPLAMFGSTNNRAVILRAMTRFIRLRKFETMSLQYILQGFKLSECAWLEDPRLGQEKSSVAHTPPTASDKKHEILHEFVFWLFDGFLMPLLQATFYITDSSYQRNKVFYYRHGLWRLITQSAVNSIQGNMFIKMEPEEVVTCNKVYSKVRFLPKTHDLRPIINLRRKAPRLVSGGLAVDYKSMNQRLNNAFLILAYERSRQMACSSAMGMSDLFYRLKQVKEKLVGLSTPNLPRLYMVKVDIKKSFDSINQENLLEIIDKTLKEDKYVIHRHSKVMPANGRMMKRFYPKATAPNQMPSFLEFARTQAEISKHAVLVDKVVHTTESKDVVIRLIKDHIQENIVKFGRHFYKQTTGIPQGSVLSPALCRFFYDEMENSVLSHLTQSDDSALVRLADDFLFISQRKDKATEFLTIMSQGHAEFGCFINEHKTIANFEVSLSDGQPVQQSQGNDFPYCGLLLHTKTMEIRADYSRYIGEDIRNLLTVSRDLQPCHSIVLKMKKAMQHMCQMAFSDTTYNSRSRVFLNIYQNFVFCAMKFHAYLLELLLDPALCPNPPSSSSAASYSSSSSSSSHHHGIIDPQELPEIVMGIFRAAYGLLHNGRRSAVGIVAGVEFQVYERHVHWLGASAFLKTLPGPGGEECQTQHQGQKKSRMLEQRVYAPVRRYLKTEIVDRLELDEQKAYFRRMLLSTVNDPRNQILDNIRYR